MERKENKKDLSIKPLLQTKRADKKPVYQSRETRSSDGETTICCSAYIYYFKRNVFTFSITVEPQNQPVTPPGFLFQRSLNVLLILNHQVPVTQSDSES